MDNFEHSDFYPTTIPDPSSSYISKIHFNFSSADPGFNMLVAIRNSWECDLSIKTNTIIVPYIEVHAAALVAVEESEELVHEDPGDAGGQQQPVHVLQLLLAQLPARTLQVETSAVSHNTQGWSLKHFTTLLLPLSDELLSVLGLVQQNLDVLSGQRRD